MLEPLFRCNLACVGCGKIDYPGRDPQSRMTAQECWDAADECGAPMWPSRRRAADPQDIGEIVRGLVAAEIRVVVHQRAAFGKEARSVQPSPYLFFSIHLDGLKDHHDKAVSQKGVFDRAVSAIKAPRRVASPSTSTQPSSTAIREEIAKSSTSRPNSRRRFDVAGLCL